MTLPLYGERIRALLATKSVVLRERVRGTSLHRHLLRCLLLHAEHGIRPNHTRRLREQHALPEWVGASRLWYKHASRLGLQHSPETLLRHLLTEGIRGHRRVLRHEEASLLHLHGLLNLRYRKRLSVHLLSSKWVLCSLLLEITGCRTDKGMSKSGIRGKAAVTLYLFVCGLNIVCCSDSIAEKKSIMDWFVGVLDSGAGDEDDVAAGSLDAGFASETVPQRLAMGRSIVLDTHLA